jgi:hypothetical protein
VSLIIIHIEIAHVVPCEHQKKYFFYQDVTMRENLLCGRSTVSQIVAVRILLELLATVTIVLSRTQDKRGRNETFGISGGTKIH